MNGRLVGAGGVKYKSLCCMVSKGLTLINPLDPEHTRLRCGSDWLYPPSYQNIHLHSYIYMTYLYQWEVP